VKKILLLLGLVVACVFLTAFLKKRAEFEKYEAMIAETNACLGMGEWKCAERNVRELLKTAPNDTNLQLHMAGILFEQERYKECVSYIETLNFKHKDLDYLVEKSNRLEEEFEKLGVEKSMHFRLEFDGNPTRKDVMEALAVLEVAHDSISSLFEFVPENKISLVLYEAPDYQGMGQRPNWVAAVFDGKLRVPANMMAYREVYRPILFHELTHAFVYIMSRKSKSVPLWMNEGIAQVIDASRTGAERPMGAAPSLKSLTEPFVNQHNTDAALKLYWYSQRMVEELLARGGEDGFRKFAKCVQEIRKLGADDALKKYFGTTSKELLESVR
jgi:hypothetical protein